MEDIVSSFCMSAQSTLSGATAVLRSLWGSLIGSCWNRSKKTSTKCNLLVNLLLWIRPWKQKFLKQMSDLQRVTKLAQYVCHLSAGQDNDNLSSYSTRVLPLDADPCLPQATRNQLFGKGSKKSKDRTCSSKFRMILVWRHGLIDRYVFKVTKSA